MTDVLEVRGVRLRRGTLRPETLAYLERKLRRIRRRSRRRRNPFHRLLQALLPRNWGHVPVESRVEGRVLVIDCGGGIETLQLQAVGIDVDRAALRIAADLQRHAIGATAAFAVASGGTLPFRDREFDSLLSDNVVEHMPEPILKLHLREARRVLRSGGWYVFTSPNRLFEDPLKDEGHVSLHSYAEWETLLEEAGFAALETPRRRSGRLLSLAWKKGRERRAARRGSRRGLSARGIRIVTILACGEAKQAPADATAR